MLDLGLAGKTVLISGGSSGIGQATATRLAAEGARLALAARGRDRLEAAAEELRRQYDADVLAVTADVSTEHGTNALVEAALGRFGRIDGLVNNAGSSAAKSFEQVTDEEWQADLDLKLFAAIRLTRLCLSHLRQSRGSIVNLLAISGKSPGARSVPTSVTRAAGLALMKALSKELAPDQVRVNAVCIGSVRSGQHDPVWQREFPQMTRDEFYADMASKRAIPMGRVGDPEEVADLIAFLLSDRATYISGTAINFDGGAAATS